MKKPSRLLIWLVSVMCSLLVVYFVLPVRITRIDGSSMSPTYLDGEWVLMNRQHYRENAIEKGDVIVFHLEDGDYIKRVYALPGDTVWLARQNDERQGWDTVLSSEQAEQILTGAVIARLGVLKIGKLVVPEGEYFVLGDNPSHSIDSRDFGTVPLSAVRGQVDPQREFGEHPPLAEIYKIDWEQLFRNCYPIR